MDSWIQALSKELFWDVDQSKVTADRHSRWLLERVLERGRWEDWLMVRDHLGKETIRDLAPTLRLKPRERHFLDSYCRP
jgi:hypothetical protein